MIFLIATRELISFYCWCWLWWRIHYKCV